MFFSAFNRIKRIRKNTESSGVTVRGAVEGMYKWTKYQWKTYNKNFLKKNKRERYISHHYIIKEHLTKFDTYL